MTISAATLPFEIKFQADSVTTGSFEGYGAVFGNVDSYGDVIVKGAFRDSLREWKKLKKLPPMLAQHGGLGLSDDDGIPVGKWTALEEDETGLKVEGRLINLDTDRGKRLYGAMREGVLDGLSIGYRVKRFTVGTKPDEPRRKLEQIDLREISIVTFPANERARARNVKSASDMTLREFEAFLRDEGGFSHARAREIARGGYKAAPRDESGADDLAAMVRRNIETLKGTTGCA